MAWHEFEIIFLFTTIVIRIQTKSDLFKNSTSPGKKAGVLEWVCKLQIHACVRDVFPLYFDTGVLGSHTGGFISCLCLFGSIRLSIRICIFLIYIVLNYNYLLGCPV